MVYFIQHSVDTQFLIVGRYNHRQVELCFMFEYIGKAVQISAIRTLKAVVEAHSST